jgi:hypothetical protein
MPQTPFSAFVWGRRKKMRKVPLRFKQQQRTPTGASGFIIVQNLFRKIQGNIIL